MSEVKIIVRRTVFCGMEKVLGKAISANKEISQDGKKTEYVVKSDTLYKNGAERRDFLSRDEWVFMFPYDIVEEVEAQNER